MCSLLSLDRKLRSSLGEAVALSGREVRLFQASFVSDEDVAIQLCLARNHGTYSFLA